MTADGERTVQDMPYRLGVDVGGTFTDLLLVSGTDAAHRIKVPSTPDDPSRAMLEGVRRLCEDSGVAPDEIAAIVHGTTVATNAVLEGKGARVGLITTRGFKQILHLARSQTPGPMHGWIIMIKPDPPALLEDTREVGERVDARGAVVRPLDPDEVRTAADELVASGVESLTVSLINSFANAEHERAIREIVRERHPDLPITISSDVLPEFREYERTVTACMNAYVRPRVDAYIGALERDLGALGFAGTLNILGSDAGLMSARFARENPIYGVLSGPSGGVAAALSVAERAGQPNILTFDMGGTSTDVALCQNGQPTVARNAELGHFRIKVPTVDVHSVGAGGGSIAHVPALTRAFRVGPQSAGAMPGPACYGRGGTEPTVTDANVVVGHLPPLLLGGAMRLDVEASERALGSIAEALELDLHRAAAGVLDIVNENMAAALRLVSVQRGYDPRDFALVAYGGAGPLHANAVAEIMGTFPVIVPPAPGLLCATGDLVADFRREFARTFIRTSDDLEMAELASVFDDLGGRAGEWLAGEGVPAERRRLGFSVDMRYHLQGHEIAVPLDGEPRTLRPEALTERFNELHQQYYGFHMEDSVCEVVNARIVARGAVSKPRSQTIDAAPDADASAAVTEQTEIYRAGEWLATRVYDRARLLAGHRVEGPAIVTEHDSTTLILPGYAATVDAHANLVIEPRES